MSPLRARERRTSLVAVWPLTVMALVFVLPTIEGCGGRVTPAEHAAESAFSALIIVPVFACAALLALLTARALRRGAVDMASRRLALLSIGVVAASTIPGVAVMLPDWWPWTIAAVSATVGATWLLRRARGKQPWQIWEHLLAAFSVIAAATYPSVMIAIVLTAGLKHGSMIGVRVGVYPYLLSLAALWLILGRAVWRARR